MLANIEVGCCFLFLLCCLKTSRVNVLLWPASDEKTKQNRESAVFGTHFHFSNCIKQLIQELFVQKSMHRSPINSNAN